MNRILITGALGQLGIEFIKYFNNSNTFVLATDIRECENEISCKFIQCDVLEKNKLNQLVEKYKIDTIFHLVAMLSAKGERYPFKSWNLNIDSFQNVIEVCIKNKIKKIFWPSSIAVFGTHSKLDFVPQNPILNPSSIYGITKLAGEKLLEYYNNKFNLDIRSIRYPGIISMSSPPGGGTTDYVIEMIDSARNKSKYICFLSQETELPMMYIDDAVSSAIQLMSTDKSKLSVKDSYNVAGFSVTPEILKTQILNNGFKIEVEYKPDFRQKIANSWPRKIDDSKAKNDWGWNAKFSLVDTVKRSLEF